MNYLIHIDKENNIPLKKYLEKLLQTSKIHTTSFAEDMFHINGGYIYVFEEGGGDWGCYGYSTDISSEISHSVMKKELTQTLSITYGEIK